MKLVVKPGAEKDIQQLSEEHQQYVKERLEELKERPVSNPDSSIIRLEGQELFRYRMKKGGKRGGKDYRAIFDIENEKIKVYAVFHRDTGYDKDSFSKRL